ncbi:MAG: hypothetical protein ACREVO_12495 [Steroidobacteraceae bacterium]
MTPHQTVAVGARLFGVWLLLDALSQGYFVLAAAKGASTSMLAGPILLTMTWVLAGVALWSFPQAIARKVLPDPMDNPVASSSGAPPDTWLATGCVLIGIWVLVSTLPSLVEDIALTWPAVHLAGSIFFVVRLLLGVWLILGAHGLRKVVSWSQYAGIRRSDG